MLLALTVLNGPALGTIFEVPDGGVYCLGSGTAAEAMLPGDPSIALAHAAIYADRDGPRVRALLAGAPVWLDEREALDEPLRDGARICVGATWLQVSRASAPRREAPPPPPERPLTRDEALARAARMLATGPGNLYALLDAARDDDVTALLRAVSHPRRCLLDRWGREAHGDVAPWLLVVPRGGALMAKLLREGWGRGWGLYVESPHPMSLVRKHLRRVERLRPEELGRGRRRWYDPQVFDARRAAIPPAALFGEAVTAFVYERGADASPARVTREG